MRIDLYRNGGYGGGGISETGGNITGPLILAGNPSQTLEAVPKQYVDAYASSLNAANFSSGTLNPARLPGFEGDLTSAPGTSVLTLTETGVVAGSYGNVTINSKGLVTAGNNITNGQFPFGVSWNKITTGKPTTLSGYGILDGVNKAGGPITGFLIINDAPVSNSHLVNKQYVTALISSGGIETGDIIRKPFNGTPTGFLRCNGAELDKTTYADLYAVIGDSFNVGNVAGSGQPWQQQYQINDTQSDNIGVWTTGTALPSLLGRGVVFVTKNRVYLCGGDINQPTFSATVYTAPINTDGTIGTWTTGPSLPGGRASASCIVTKNRVYLFGGYTGSASPTDTVYTTVINSDGTIGNWTTSANLPGNICESSAIITKNRVYLLGGYNGSSYISTVYTAIVAEGLNDYSPYYDGSILPVEPINPSSVFKIPDHSSTDINGVFHYIKY